MYKRFSRRATFGPQLRQLQPGTFSSIKQGETSIPYTVDYSGLNQITKNYPLLLEQLHTTKSFTKLDLHSVYSLMHVKPGDVRKMAFSATFGHYEYLVIPYGLSGALQCYSV